jgi:hypothetical protein
LFPVVDKFETSRYHLVTIVVPASCQQVDDNKPVTNSLY